MSMTGFATARGEAAGRAWLLEARSVNARGLDVRLRLNEGYPLDETALRARLRDRFARGGVTIALRADPAAAEAATPSMNRDLVGALMASTREIEAWADQIDLSLARTSAGDLLRVRGVVDSSPAALSEEDEAALGAALTASVTELLDDLEAARADEGRRLSEILGGLVDEIESLTAAAAQAYDEQQDGAKARLEAKLAEFGDVEVPADRLAQEIALAAVRSDIREELDRLTAHVTAMRGLLGEAGPIGRKIDFLAQEMTREANTICSKAGSLALTNVGIDLKTAIDRIKEQAANVE